MKWISEHQPINFAVRASLGLHLFMPRNTNWRIDKSEIIKQQSDHQTRRLLLDIVPCSSELYESYACTYVRVHVHILQIPVLMFWVICCVGVNGVFCHLVHLRARVPIIMHIPCFLFLGVLEIKLVALNQTVFSFSHQLDDQRISNFQGNHHQTTVFWHAFNTTNLRILPVSYTHLRAHET